MTYEQQIRMIVTYLYNTTKCFATSSTYHISYEAIANSYGLWVGNHDVQLDIREEFGNNHLDRIQALDFDDVKEEVIVMIWESNNKKKKYTIDNYEEFCSNALQAPPIEEFEEGKIDEVQWYKDHMIHITVGNHDIELGYFADNVNEIEWALQEMYAAEYDGPPTTGNTVGSEYPNATWKDILRFAVLSQLYDNECEDYKEAIWKCIHRFTKQFYTEVMQKIEAQTSYNDELEVNFFKLDTKDLWKIFDEEERRQAFKEILCSKIEIEELIDENGAHGDKVVITDYSIRPSGDLVGWHYGVEWDKNHEDNQWYVRKYIEEMTK